MRKQKSWKRPRSLCWDTETLVLLVLTMLSGKHITVCLYMHLQSICGFSLYVCMLYVRVCVCMFANVLYIYLHLGLRITCPNRSQGKAFIWRTFTEMILILQIWSSFQVAAIFLNALTLTTKFT